MSQFEKDKRPVNMGVLVRQEQRQALAELARQRDRSVSSVMRLAIDDFLAREQEALDGVRRQGGEAA